ncbi:avidin-like, partial [Corapipo altera]|uniref:avidin-like n=1 Tax=Corapipo altera TaxID=415028 RepID=UPI000FD687AB
MEGAEWAWGSSTGRATTTNPMGTLDCCLLLTLVLLIPQQAATRKCDLQGLWRNKLGSNMTLLVLNTAGTFSGFYHTAVTTTNKQSLGSPLQGAQQHPGAKRHPTFGFTVHWQFSGTAYSTTAFVGQGFVDRCGKETLETTWLL